jgi:diadenosine tetraphosphatase ApaH/serine/threonine PP2A family protein phosphatase
VARALLSATRDKASGAAWSIIPTLSGDLVRLLLLSDLHSNLEALEACLDAAPAYEDVVNLGDVVGYGANPNEVIERARALGKHFVRGNHDKAAAGLMDLDEFNPIAALAAHWTRTHITPENLEWLRALPQGPIQLPGLPDVQFVHGSPLDEDDYVVSTRDALEPLLTAQVPVTFFGHSHVQGAFIAGPGEAGAYRPVYRNLGQRVSTDWPLRPEAQYLVNPGSVGQPRDGDWRAGFALFDSEARVVTFYRVPYDLKHAQESILAANLPQRLATRLAAGR